MLPDLGRYAFEVLGAYAASFAMVGGLVLASFRRGARVKRRLAEAERSRSAAGRRP